MKVLFGRNVTADDKAISYEQALRALWRRNRKRKESLQIRLWNLNSTSKSPLGPGQLNCQISANQREAETSANVTNIERHVPNDVISNVISANQHFASKYIQSPQTQLQALLPFLAPPPERPGELARRQTMQGHFKIKRSNSTARTVRILVDTRVCVC